MGLKGEGSGVIRNRSVYEEAVAEGSMCVCVRVVDSSRSKATRKRRWRMKSRMIQHYSKIEQRIRFHEMYT